MASASRIFSGDLKCENISPINKKGNLFDMKNYRSVSILPLVSKLYGKIISEQISNYFGPFLKEFCVDFEKHTVIDILYLNY